MSQKNIEGVIHNIWLEEIRKKPKLRTYATFKENISVESYVKQYYTRDARSLLAQFRLGILPLHIETGRYANLPVENRLCNVCNSGDIEDEIHFLCKCQKYVEERKDLYDYLMSKVDGFDTFNDHEILCNVQKYHQKALSKFVCNAWRIRQTYHFK